MFSTSAAPDHQDVRTAEFTKGPGDSLGVSIAGGVGSPLGNIPIFIAMMNPVGLAAQTQKLMVRHFPFILVSLCKVLLSLPHQFAGHLAKNFDDSAGGGMNVAPQGKVKIHVQSKLTPKCLELPVEATAKHFFFFR